MTQKTHLNFLISLLILHLATTVKATELEEMTFGIEPTAGSDVDTVSFALPESKAYVEYAARAFSRKIGGTVREEGRTFVVRAPNGEQWIFHDDGGALEVPTPVLKASDVEKQLIPLFETFEEVGLKTEVTIAGQFLGGGHIHVGKNIFAKNPLLLRNLIVDKQNKPYISAFFEEMGDDQALSLRDRNELIQLKDALSKLDPEFKANRPPHLQRFYEELPMDRYTAVNTQNIPEPNKPTIELRDFRPPVSARAAALRVLFLAAYLRKLDNEKGLIPLKELTEAELIEMESPRGCWEFMKREFTELGLNPDDYRSEWEARFPKLFSQNANAGTVEIRPGRQLGGHTFIEVTLNSSSGDNVTLEYEQQSFSPLLKKVSDKTKTFVFKLPIQGREKTSRLVLTVENSNGEPITSLSGKPEIQWSRPTSKPSVPDEMMLELLGSSDVSKKTLGLALCRDFDKYPQAVQEIRRLIASGIKEDAYQAIDVLRYEQWSRHPDAMKWLESLVAAGNSDLYLAQQLLSHEHWAMKIGADKVLEKLIMKNVPSHNIATYVLSREHWAKHPSGIALLEKLIAKGGADVEIAMYVLSQEHWARHPKTITLMEKLIASPQSNSYVAKYVLAKEHWMNHPEAAKLLDALITMGNANKEVAMYILNRDFWAKHPRGIEFLKRLIQAGNANPELATFVLRKEYWTRHPEAPELLQMIIKAGNANNELARYVLREEFWSRQQDGITLLEQLIMSGNADTEIKWNVLTRKYWANHPRVKALCEGKEVTVQNIRLGLEKCRLGKSLAELMKK